MQANQGSGTGSCVLLNLPHAAGCFAIIAASVNSVKCGLNSGTCGLYLLLLAAQFDTVQSTQRSPRRSARINNVESRFKHL
jgi:hypothetical protein